MLQLPVWFTVMRIGGPLFDLEWTAGGLVMYKLSRAFPEMSIVGSVSRSVASVYFVLGARFAFIVQDT